MFKFRICEDLDECRTIWKKIFPEKCIFDLWAVRKCFAEAFERKQFFLVVEENRSVQGLLVLAWINEENYYGNFPGEVWNGKTWLEQNKIISINTDVAKELLSSIPRPAKMRYLLIKSCPVNR